jgi:hypothetical protein
VSNKSSIAGFGRAMTASGALAAALACEGCANFIAIDVHDPAQISAELEAGSKIRVRAASGERHMLRVEAAGADHLMARDRAGAEVRIDYADDPKIERRHFAPGKTAALAIGLTIVVYEIMYAVATVELAGSL